MAAVDLRKALASCPASVWKKAILLGHEDAPTDWAPVVGIPSSKLDLGVTRQGAWMIQVDPGRIEALSSSADPRLTLFLGEIIQRVEDDVEDGFEEMGLPRQLAGVFPFGLIVQCGLRSASESARSAALAWASFLETDLEVASALRRISMDQNVDYLSRQEAKRILHKWKLK